MLDLAKESVVEFLAQGGIVMLPLVILSLILFTAVFRLANELLHTGRGKHPGFFSASNVSPSPDYDALVSERRSWQSHFDRRFKFVRIVSATAPLLGLLGTVGGMLQTFKGMGQQNGANAMDLIANGISQALITTEMGLSIAILGFAFLYVIKGWRRRLIIQFERLEIQQLLA